MPLFSTLASKSGREIRRVLSITLARKRITSPTRQRGIFPRWRVGLVIRFRARVILKTLLISLPDFEARVENKGIQRLYFPIRNLLPDAESAEHPIQQVVRVHHPRQF